MKQKYLFMPGLAAILLVFVLILTGCPTEADPESEIAQELKGKWMDKSVNGSPTALGSNLIIDFKDNVTLSGPVGDAINFEINEKKGEGSVSWVAKGGTITCKATLKGSSSDLFQWKYTIDGEELSLTLNAGTIATAVLIK